MEYPVRSTSRAFDAPVFLLLRLAFAVFTTRKLIDRYVRFFLFGINSSSFVLPCMVVTRGAGVNGLF